MSTAQPSSLRARQRERTRTALLAAAETQFAERGFTDATVEDIATAAEVSVRSLYNAFGDKTGLYLAVVELALEANRVYMDAAWDPHKDAVEQLVASSDAYLRFYVEHPGFFQMVALPQLRSRPGDEHADVAERIARRVETEVGRVELAIRDGIASGHIRDDVDPALAAKFLWAAWNGVIALSTRPDRLRAGDEQITQILDAGRRVVLDGLLGGKGH